MYNMRITAAALIIAVVLVVGFVLSVPHVRDLGGSAAMTESATPSVYVHDAYAKGTHTLSVKVVAPNACTRVEGQASVATGTPPTILLALTMPEDSGICLQAPATTTLSLSASATSEVRFAATINGNNATTTKY